MEPPKVLSRFSASGNGGSFHCENVDLAQVRQLSHSLLLSLAAACVEKTYGDPFKSPISVAASLKGEMVSFLAAQAPRISEMAPLDVVEELLDEFVQSNTSFFSRISSKLMSNETKEEKVEDLAEDMETAETWASSDRDQVAMALLRNLDTRGLCVCKTTFETEEELTDHKSMCPFRPITCGNDNCGDVFSALHVLKHDTECPFKLLSCEQHCEAILTRSEMDKHCVTVCPMRPIKCPFFHVGCTDLVPYRNLAQHCQESVGSHLTFALQALEKQETNVSSLTHRVLLLEKALSINERSEAVDVGTLRLTIQQQDAKIRSLEQEIDRLRQDLRKHNSMGEVVQLRAELETLRNKLGN
ncbi:hypothetical protein KP509_36G047000 [Ceratopteris richardii]|uniref:TRAF-type domain-containing protein n=1 Tax=Ceratopteris richardii TaxID=49495 RepID=A0A8T2QCU8_CERRI|nr:hypothetical protein KP509_36G047000 [Ceratopteris richardii]